MHQVKLLFILIVSLCFVVDANSQNLPPEITVTGEQIYCYEAPIPIVTSATITDPDVTDNTLDEIYIQISEGYSLGNDTLTLGGVNPNITASWSITEALLTLTGPATFAEFETAIENVFFETTQTAFTSDRSFSINLGNANFLPSTGHYYFYVADLGITWAQARDAAAAQTYFGLQGYLATLTSQEEAQLAGEQSAGTGWIGASDQEVEGTWKWVTGPEAGMVFYIGAVNGSAPNGEFSFWNCGEPNNFGGNEDYAHITDQSVACAGRIGSWNDLPINSGESNPNNPYYPKGYIVEFGGFPGEPEINLSASSVVIMPRVEAEEQQFCGNDVELTVSANTSNVLWYESPSSATVIHSGFNYTTTLSGTTTFWLEAEENGCGSITRSPLTVFVNDNPSVNDITITQCDDEVIDGITTFVLSDSDDAIINGNSINFQVQYFIDDTLNLEIVTPAYTNQFNNQLIYVRVTNTTTGCSSVSEVTLFVKITSANSAVLNACDSLNEDGFTVFNLMDANDQLLNGLSTDVQVDGYYESYNNAILDVNAIVPNYTNDLPYNQTVYARLEQNLGCYAIAEIELVVDELPQLLPDEEVFYCLNTFPETIRLDGGIINDIPNNYYY
ncbi:MAG: lectin, partial [Bacteroidia bacterium]|nr:lectin [Bacteroidia bacterium]